MILKMGSFKLIRLDISYFHGFLKDFKSSSVGIKFYLDDSSFHFYFKDGLLHGLGYRNMGEKS